MRFASTVSRFSTRAAPAALCCLVLTSFASRASRAAEIHLRLGDIVGGGDGCGIAPTARGINPRDGKLAKENAFAGSGGVGPTFKAADGVGGKVNYPLVDGVMNINGTSQIDSLGGTFAFPATQNATTWDAIRNDVALLDGGGAPLAMQLNDQPGVDRGGIGLHTNCGVTFDLAAIRAQYGGAQLLRTEGVGGLNWEACTNANVDLWIVVDGALRFHQPFLYGGDFMKYSIPLADTDRFLTIAGTDNNQSDGCDHGVVADAILVIDAPIPDCNANFVADACELLMDPSMDCDANQVPDGCQWSYLPNGSGCAGTNGYIPSLAISGCAVVGGAFTISIQGGKGGASAFLFLGAGSQITPIPGPGGCSLNISGVLPFVVPITLGGSLPGTGNTFFHVPVPHGPALVGTFAIQAFVADPFAIQDFSATNGVAVYLH